MRRRLSTTSYNPYHWLEARERRYVHDQLNVPTYKFIKASKVKRSNRPSIPDDWRRLIKQQNIEQLNREYRASLGEQQQ